VTCKMLLFLPIGAVIASSAACAQDPGRIVSVGPSGKYTVELQGEMKAPSIFGEPGTVVAKITGPDGFLASPIPVHFVDFMERDFRQEFPVDVWPADDVFQLLTASSNPHRVTKRVHLENASTEQIPVVELHAFDLFLAFRVGPGVKRTLNVTWGHGLPCIHARARRIDGSIASKDERCFSPEVMSFSVVFGQTGAVISAER
jgi:hypothetical protein